MPHRFTTSDSIEKFFGMTIHTPPLAYSRLGKHWGVEQKQELFLQARVTVTHQLREAMYATSR